MTRCALACVVLAVALTGCVVFQSYTIDTHERVSTATFPAKPDDCVVEVFELEPIESSSVPGWGARDYSRFGEYGDVDMSEIVNRPHETVERFEMTAGDKYKALLDEARKLACRAGADALVFQSLPQITAGGQDGDAEGTRPRARGWVIKFQ